MFCFPLSIFWKSRLKNSSELVECPHNNEQSFRVGREGLSCKTAHCLLGLFGEKFQGQAALHFLTLGFLARVISTLYFI